MRTWIFALSLLAGAGFGLPVLAGKTPPQTLPETEEPFVHHDACFGDRYESDKDLNDGNEISDKELQDLIEQMNGPGV